jgi:hypothetical protein
MSDDFETARHTMWFERKQGLAALDRIESQLLSLTEERDAAQHEASRLHECRDTWKAQAESLTEENDLLRHESVEVTSQLASERAEKSRLIVIAAEAEQRAAHWELAYNARLAGHALSPIDPPLVQQGEPK